MISMEPVLKRGYATWDRDVLPQDEFASRIDSIREALRADGLDALIVINYSLLGVMVDYADIAYLSGLQSGGALLVTLDEDPALVTFGGGRELFFMRTQTWIPEIIAGSGRPFDVLRDLLQQRGITAGAIATVGTRGMPANVSSRLAAALAGHELRPFEERLRALRSRKRPREIFAVQIAKGIVEDAAAAAVAVFDAGADNAAAMIEAERVARARKARDIRVLANMDAADLRPWEGRLAGRHAPLRLWVAAQYQGYWAETAVLSPASADNAASKVVSAMKDVIRPNVTAGDVAAAALAVLPAAAVESALVYGLGGAIGLALNEGLTIQPGSTDVIVEGSLLSLTAHVTDAPQPAIASLLVHVGADGATALTAQRIP
jgi:Xaa-Pro aminopeptidase